MPLRVATAGLRGRGRNAYGPIWQYENEMGDTITLVAWPDTTCREGYSLYSLAQVKDLIARFDPGGFMARNLGVEIDTRTGDLVLSQSYRMGSIARDAQEEGDAA